MCMGFLQPRASAHEKWIKFYVITRELWPCSTSTCLAFSILYFTIWHILWCTFVYSHHIHTAQNLPQNTSAVDKIYLPIYFVYLLAMNIFFPLRHFYHPFFNRVIYLFRFWFILSFCLTFQCRYHSPHFYSISCYFSRRYGSKIHKTAACVLLCIGRTYDINSLKIFYWQSFPSQNEICLEWKNEKKKRNIEASFLYLIARIETELLLIHFFSSLLSSAST